MPRCDGVANGVLAEMMTCCAQVDRRASTAGPPEHGHIKGSFQLSRAQAWYPRLVQTNLVSLDSARKMPLDKKPRMYIYTRDLILRRLTSHDFINFFINNNFFFSNFFLLNLD